MRLQADSIRARLHIDPTGWRPATDSDADTSMLPPVQEALARDCKLTFLYTRADGDTAPRTVDPLGIVCKQAVWYLVAQTPTGMRTYRLSRMRDVVPLALTFTRPANFDLATHWNQSTATFTDSREKPTSATLALSPQAIRIINGWCPMTLIPNHPATPSLPQTWQVYEVQFETPQQARFTALGLGSQAITLAPTTLRQEIAADQRSSLKLQS
jgi:predicted DNA-binding transcriptional regulator YafY